MSGSHQLIDITPFWKKKRYLIVLLAFFGYVNLYTLRVDMSIAIVSLIENRTIIHENGSISHEQEFDFSARERGWALGSFFYGYIMTNAIGGYIASKFSGRLVFGSGILMASIVTCLTPMLIHRGIFYLFLARALVGIFSGLSFPSVNAVYDNWCPQHERSRMSNIGISGVYFGTVVAMMLSGWLATRFGWESIFYTFGISSLFWSFFWFLIVRDSPLNDRWVTKSEKDYILSNIKESGQKHLKTPWLAIFTSMPVWAVSVAHFSYSYGYFTLITELPSYMKNIVDFDLTTSGFVSAIPYILLIVLLFPSGYLADWLQIQNILSTSQVRKFFNNISFFAQMIFLLLAAYFTNKVHIVICISLSIGLGAFSMSGFLANTLDIAPQFSSIVLGISNSVATLPGLISPVVNGYILHPQTPTDKEYKAVFFIASGIYLIGIFFYAIYATGKVQPWAKQEVQNDTNENQEGVPKRIIYN